MEKFGHCFMTIYLEVSSTQRTWKLPQPRRQKKKKKNHELGFGVMEI